MITAGIRNHAGGHSGVKTVPNLGSLYLKFSTVGAAEVELNLSYRKQ